MNLFRPLLLILALSAGAAQAQHFDKGFAPSGWGHGYHAPRPRVFVPPPPIFYAPPPPVFYAPPRPIFVPPPPVYYAPRPYYGRPHWHRRHW